MSLEEAKKLQQVALRINVLMSLGLALFIGFYFCSGKFFPDSDPLPGPGCLLPTLHLIMVQIPLLFLRP